MSHAGAQPPRMPLQLGGAMVHLQCSRVYFLKMLPKIAFADLEIPFAASAAA